MGKQVRLELEQLHPTQVTAGMLEVGEERKHFASLSSDKLKRALKAVPISAVLDCDGTYFATNHHYLARALSDAKIAYAHVQVLADFSKLKDDAFWPAMAANGGCILTMSTEYCMAWLPFRAMSQVLSTTLSRSFGLRERRRRLRENARAGRDTVGDFF
nr:hypothetical protein HUO10_005327 [Paraburkholderia busanensis]